MNALQGCYAFVIGLGLGYVYLKTGNIIITMILHMVYNLSTSFISYLPWDQVDAMIPSKFMPEVSFVVLVVGLMASYGGSKILAKSKKGVN
jgi:membrane protease YdiL (CAAX protease family)